MEEWKTYKVEDLIEEIAMGPFGSNIKVECFKDSGIPVLNGSNLYGFKLNEESFNYVSEEKADSLGHSNAYRGDVVITHRGTLGQIVYIPLDSKFQRYVISQSQFRLKLDRSKVLPEFFVYFFHTRIGQHRLLSNASQVGVPAIARPTSTFRKVEIELPSLSYQQRIVKLLDSIGDKIELNNLINHNLEEQAQALYKSWFVDFEPFKDGEFVESELGMIPKGWHTGELSEICEIVGGATPSRARNEFYTSNGIAWLTPKDLSMSCNKFTDRGSEDISEIGYKSCSAKLMPRGSVLFSSRAPIGYITIAKNEICTNQGFKSAVPAIAGTAFLYFYLKNSIEMIESKASGSTFKEASGALMKSLPVVIPSKDVLKCFEDKVIKLFNMQETCEDENNRLDVLRDKILPKLMSGELNINGIDC